MAHQYSDEELQARSDALRNVQTTDDLMALIRRQREMHDGPTESQPRATRQAFLPGKVMTSRFAGKCADCGQWMAEGTEIRYDGKAHHYPACPVAPTPDEDRFPLESAYMAEPYEGPSAPAATPAATGKALADGKWTLQYADGHYRTFRIVTQAEDASFAPGKRIVQFLSGPDNEFSYTSFAFITDNGVQLWKRFRDDSQLAKDAALLLDVEGAKAAGLAYAMASGHCCRCGRTLTVPASLHMGMGPDCAAKGWF